MTDPTTRYYAETPCGTCRGTGWIPDDPDGWDVPDMSMSGCPDCQPKIGGTGIGSRSLLTVREVDYEAAARALMPLSSFHVGSLSLDDIRQAVDAALGGSVVLVEEGEWRTDSPGIGLHNKGAQDEREQAGYG